MESIYILLAVCMFIFLLFSLYEIVELKKQINKLNGIVNHLLEDHSNNK